MTRNVGGNQERYLLAERFTDASYPIPFSYRISGELDIARLRSAFRTIVLRHEVLRASFRPSGTGFVADIAADVDIALEHRTLDGADEAELKALVAEYFDEKVARLKPSSLTRALIVSLAEDRHVFTVSLHHAIGDAISVDIVVEELFALYRGETLPDAPPSYYDVMAGADAAAPPQDIAFWREALADVEDVAGLRADVDDPTAAPGEHEMTLDFAPVAEIAQRCGTTPFEAMLALTAAIVSAYADTDDVQVTFQSSGRKLLPQSAGVVGPFSNTVVLRARVDREEPFAALALRTKEQVKVALSHERHPYHLVVRETGVQPNFGVNWFPLKPSPRVDGLAISDREFLFYDSNYDLNLRFARDGAKLRGLFHFRSSAISPARVRILADALARAVTIAASDPHQPVAALLPTPDAWSPVAAYARDDESLVDRFLDNALAEPARAAVSGEGRTFSYGEVERASAAVAGRLLAAGLGYGSRVAILAKRGPALVWTMLGVLRIGATMIPLDGEYPPDRLRLMAEVAGVEAIVLPVGADRPEWVREIPAIHADTTVPADLAPTDPRLRATGGDAPAYMLFTSGSTGVPKCIATGHAPALNFLQWQRETFALTAQDRFTNLCGIAHDMMIRDVFAPLSVGAQLAIPAQETIFQPGKLLEWCREQRPTVSHLTPAMGKLLAMAAGDAETLPLRLMFFGGDRLQPDLVRDMATLAPQARIVNFYGTTETPQAAAFHLCDPRAAWRTHPIGKGIRHFDLRIVDRQHRPVADGVPGEIVVRSPLLSMGYVIDGTIVPHDDPTTYHTGDLGMVLADGEIMFLGRRDDQISIRGYRIELEEISNTLLENDGVGEAAVLIDSGRKERLVAFVSGRDLDADDLYAWLNQRLPHYMVPADIVCLPALPLLPNGKLDRRSLLALPRPKRRSRQLREPETEMERKLVEAWKAQLDIDGISPEQSFAELRGDSLAYVQVLLASEELLGELPEDWQTIPIEQLAERNGSRSRKFRWIDSALAIRAAAIVMVVSLHLHIVSFGGGATSALFIVSGFLIGKLQLREAVRQLSVVPFLALLWRVLLPSAIYTTLFSLSKLVLSKPISLAVPLMYSDFVDYRDHARTAAEGDAFFLWYIASFMHILLIIIAAFWLVFRFVPDKVTAPRLAAWLFAVGLPLKFVLPGLFDPSIYHQGIPPLSVYGFLPTSHLSTLMLGVCLAMAETGRERAAWAFVTLLYSAATYFYVPANSFVTMLLAGGLLLFAPRMPLPKWLHPPILYLSGASLFIYLTHQQFAQVAIYGGVPEKSLVLIPIVIAGGVLVWMVWQKLSPVTRRISPL